VNAHNDCFLTAMTGIRRLMTAGGLIASLTLVSPAARSSESTATASLAGGAESAGDSPLAQPTRAGQVDGKPADLPARRQTLPPRPLGAIGGRAFMERIRSLGAAAREAAILHEVTSGNIPDFLREFKPAPIRAGDLQGLLMAMPDYLSVGSDGDFVRLPMTPRTAQAIADRFGCTLPTRKMVDAIDAAAEVRLAPRPLTEERESVAAFLRSNDLIEQLGAGKPLGALTAGAKKDIVLSPRIHQRPGRVCIYGWRQLDGAPIQPLTNVHADSYVDYSHGVRLIRNELLVGGRRMTISELLQDPDRSSLLSDEGAIVPPRYPTD
jgi:hypothetical protein